MTTDKKSQHPSARRLRSALALAAKLAFSSILVALILRKYNLHSIVIQVKGAHVPWLFAAGGIFALNTVLLGLRWSTLSLGLLTFSQAFRYTWVGLFFGAVIPGGISGDIAKGLSLAYSDTSLRTRLLPVSILFDKIVGLSVLAVFFLLSLFASLRPELPIAPPLHKALQLALVIVLVAFTVGILGLLFLRTAAWKSIMKHFEQTRLGNILDTIGSIPSIYRNRRRALFSAFTYSVVGHLGNAVGNWLILESMGLHLGFTFAFILYSVLSVATMIPISISGVGVRDIVSAGLFAVFGHASEAGVAFSWIVLSINIPMVAIGGALQGFELLSKHKHRLTGL